MFRKKSFLYAQIVISAFLLIITLGNYNNITQAQQSNNLVPITQDNAAQVNQLGIVDCVLPGVHSAIYSVTFSPDGTMLASANGDNSVHLWDVVTGGQLNSFKGQSDDSTIKSAKDVAFNPDGSILASIGSDGIQLRDVATGEVKFSLGKPSNRLEKLEFSPDGQILATLTSSRPSTIVFWSVVDGSELTDLEWKSDDILRDIAVSSDGRFFAAGGDKTLQIWNWATKTEVITIDDMKNITSIIFSPNSSLLVASSTHGGVRLWDTATWEELIKLPLSHAWAAEFSPDGLLLATHGSLGQKSGIRLWDTATWNELVTLEGHTRTIRELVFNPQGTLLASGSDDGTIRLWGVSSDSMPVYSSELTCN